MRILFVCQRGAIGLELFKDAFPACLLSRLGSLEGGLAVICSPLDCRLGHPCIGLQASGKLVVEFLGQTAGVFSLLGIGLVPPGREVF